jgi:hypothetical protein
VSAVDVETMVGFGPKQAWLAVRDGEPAAVAAALGLRELGPVSWRVGIDLSYLTDDRIAMSPLLTGAGGGRWLLATGQWLMLHAVRADATDLSMALGTEVQRFATHRVLEAHEWSRAIDGELVRAFAYIGAHGEVTHWVGDPDETEATFGVTAEPDEDEPPSFVIGEEDVMRMAAAWSVNPSTLDGEPAPGPLLMFATT